MRSRWHRMAGLLLACTVGPTGGTAARQPATPPAAVSEKTAVVDGVAINYKVTGQGPAVVLLHGYAQTSQMWMPLMPLLAGSYTVIAPDLRGAGGSDRTMTGYDKKTLAKDIRGLIRQLGFDRVQVVGHDIGLMVAYAYAAQYPNEVTRVLLMDAFLPGVGAWQDVWLLRDLWHFHFHGETPLALVKGRERTYLEHFWNDFAADRTRSVPEADRQIYAAAYARADGMRAGFEYFKAFEQDAKDFAGFSQTKLSMPFLVLTGEKASGTFLIDQVRLVATNVRGVVVKGSGHWLIDEAPAEVIPAIVAFLSARADPGQRLTPAEMASVATSSGAAGTSGVAGIETTILQGDPAAGGLYTIMLKVPPHTKIQAHKHPDERVGTVISGTWYFGYGASFEERALKALPPGSFYTEPPHRLHFAKTGDTSAVVHITGVGPTGTHYPGGGTPPQTDVTAQPSAPD